MVFGKTPVLLSPPVCTIVGRDADRLDHRGRRDQARFDVRRWEGKYRATLHANTGVFQNPTIRVF